VGGTCNPNGGKEKYVKVIDGKARGKEPLGRPRCRWVDDIKMSALLNSVMNLRVP
jgi:hypothetical protein